MIVTVIKDDGLTLIPVCLSPDRLRYSEENNATQREYRRLLQQKSKRLIMLSKKKTRCFVGELTSLSYKINY